MNIATNLESMSRSARKLTLLLSSLDPSGIRIGTAALTTRGIREGEMKRVGQWILEVLRAPNDEQVIQRVRGEIGEFTKNYAVPGIA